MAWTRDGSLANWTVPGRTVKQMGGLMHLVAGVKPVRVAMGHPDRHRQSKVLDQVRAKSQTLSDTGHIA